MSFHPKASSFSVFEVSKTENKGTSMSPIGFSLLFLLSLTLVSIAESQERAPHGLVNESPVALPPSAYNFFHPNTKPEAGDACSASKCSPLPEAAQVEVTQLYESKALNSQKGGKQLGARGIVGIVFGVAFVALAAMGVYYVRAKSQANMSRANTVQPQA